LLKPLTIKPAVKAAAAILVVVLAWHIASLFVNSFFLPSPLDVAPRLVGILSRPSTWKHLAISFSRIAIGLAAGLAAGLAMGVAPRYAPKASFIVEGIVQPLLESVPTICWALIFAAILGLSGAAAIMVVAVAVTPFFTVNVWEGVKELDEALIEMAQSFTANKLRILRYVVLPMIYPYLFAALRTSFQVSWKVVIIGEVFGAVDGLGYMLWLAFSSYDPTSLFSWVLISASVIAFFEYVVFNYLDAKLVRRWRR